MKKFIYTICALVYLATTTGFVVSSHYCMERLDSVEIGGTQHDKCDKCGMHKDGKCCRDEVKVYKINPGHSSVSFKAHELHPVTLPQQEFFIHQETGFRPAFVTYNADNGPPPGQPLHILHCLFRI